jgi:dihydrofolate reductase
MMISIDGYFTGPNGEIDWHNVDDEFNEMAIANLKSLDLLMFGRVTYQLMASYWPTEAAIKDDPIVAGLMNSLPKIVFSKTLEKAEWQNTRLVKENIEDEVRKIKEQPGKNIAIFGSSDLAVSLIKAGLIDELFILVNPIILGEGKTLFKGIGERVKLKLLKAQTFKSGNVGIWYKPE